MIRWDAPGYVVAFTTRVGGVSEGVYASLNLTARHRRRSPRGSRRTAASPVRGVGARPRAARVQPAGALDDRAPGAGWRAASPATGSGATSPALPMLAFAADCLPIAIARTDGAAGARGRARGLARPRRRRRRRGRRARSAAGATAAVVGPAIGPCCYEVGDEVAALFDADSDASTGGSISGRRRSGRCGGRRRRASSGSTSARAATRALLLAPAQRRARGVQGVIGAVA